jgi:hypothetical protein
MREWFIRSVSSEATTVSYKISHFLAVLTWDNSESRESDPERIGKLRARSVSAVSPSNRSKWFESAFTAFAPRAGHYRRGAPLAGDACELSLQGPAAATVITSTVG